MQFGGGVLLLTLLLIVGINVSNKPRTIIKEFTKEQVRKEFAIYKQNADKTNYEISNDNKFPEVGYLLNETKTVCKGYNDQEIKPVPVVQELTNGVINGSISINSNNTIYCDLYFDKNETPTISKFDVTGKTSGNQNLTNGFTYQTDNLPFNVTYTDTESDVKQYCINETNNTTNCNWQTLSGTSGTYTLTSKNDGTKTIYIFLKDKANNISISSSKSITVDKTAPVVTSFTLTGTNDTNQTLSNTSTYTHKKEIKYSATITETNMEGYCIYEGSSCSYNNNTTATITNQSYTLANETEGQHTINIKVKDKAGNESVVDTNSTKKITLDKTNPTSTISSKSVTTNSITVTVGNSGTDISGIVQRQCKINDQSNWKDADTNGDCTINSLDDGTVLKAGTKYVVEARVKDGSGRWSSNNANINVTTEKAGFSGTGKQLIDYNPKGLSETEIGGMRRFVGTKDDVNNYVCFGYSLESDCNAVVAENDYIYRIIGIMSDGRMKLIKNKSVNQMMQWGDSSLTRKEWPDTLLYKNINGEDFLTSLSRDSQKKILTTTWRYGDITDYDYDWISTATGDDLYKIETGSSERWDSLESSSKPWSATTMAKVGLMYLSDFYYSYGGETKCYPDWDSCWYSWFLMNNSETLGVCGSEWTMDYWGPRREGKSGSCSAWTLSEIGRPEIDLQNTTLCVRPVFFLDGSTMIVSGSGGANDPFIVT